LDNGAEINQRGANGQTALADAVSNGQVDMVKFLLLHGADVNARGMYGCTPLHIAAFRNDVETGRILLKYGANPNLKCNGHPVSDEFLKSIVYNNVYKRP
jgi:ankyrin repeat protein